VNYKSWQHLYVGAIALLLLALLWHHWQIITAAVPLDLYEGTMVLITGIIAEGGNPYTRELQPQAADVYPPLYNILAALLSQLFGNHFQLHRALSAFFMGMQSIRSLTTSPNIWATSGACSSGA
jgi:4-amino-4-deoxy-L-arabinose transferase-like glycosyltransferase